MPNGKRSKRRALELYSKASETDIRPDAGVVSDSRTRERITGQAPGGAYGWLFRPGRPETLAQALKRLPSLGAHAFFTAGLLAEASAKYPNGAELAATGLRDWLDKLIAEPAGWRVAKMQARQLARTTDAAAVSEMLTDYLSQDGPVAREQAKEEDRDRRIAEALTELAARQADLKEEGARISEDHRQRQEEQLALMREAEERFERIRLGEATEEDLAWQEQITDEVLALDPQELLAEAEADLTKTRERRAAFEERMRVRDVELERMRADIERQLRLRTGRATVEDLAWLQQERLATAPTEKQPS